MWVHHFVSGYTSWIDGFDRTTYFWKIAGVIIFTSGILVLVKTAALSKNLTNPLELFASWESYVFVSSTHFPALSISLIFTLNPTDFDCSLRFGSLFENIRPRYPALFRIRLEHVWFSNYHRLAAWINYRNVGSATLLCYSQTLEVFPNSFLIFSCLDEEFVFVWNWWLEFCGCSNCGSATATCSEPFSF